MKHHGIFDKRGMIAHLRGQFQINWMGHHGIPHWMRVRVNGIMLARHNDANVHVLELFAFFHDAKRVNEHQDDGHEVRGHNLLGNYVADISKRLIKTNSHSECGVGA